MSMPPFHLAFPVYDLPATRAFYEGLLGAHVGRTSERWIDFDFYGHQITAHLVEGEAPAAPTNSVDGKQVPVRHFGVILSWDAWEALAEKLNRHRIEYLIEPGIRFAGQVGEQGTFFVLDPSGNGLEFKTFKDFNQIYAS